MQLGRFLRKLMAKADDKLIKPGQPVRTTIVVSRSDGEERAFVYKDKLLGSKDAQDLIDLLLEEMDEDGKVTSPISVVREMRDGQILLEEITLLSTED